MFRPLSPVEEFVPVEGVVQRISFVLADERGVLIDTRGRTLVAVWPSDGAGRPDAAAIRRGEVEILSWTLPPATQLELRRLGAAWPLADHDFRVRGPAEAPLIVPLLTCLRTLTAELGLGLEARVDSARRLLAA